MTSLDPQKAASEILPGLPLSIYTLSGVLVDTSGDVWAYRDQALNISLNFSTLPPISEKMLHCFKLVLIWYAQNKSAWHLKNMFSRMKGFLVNVAKTEENFIDFISHNHVINFYSGLVEADKWHLGALKGFFLKWHSLNLPGISREVILLLKQMRIRGNSKGIAVLTMDPEEGPFTDMEREAIQAGVDEAYSKKFIAEQDYLLIYLFMLLGQRSIQYASLKVEDIKEVAGEDGSHIYLLQVPRAKKRGQLARASFRERILIPQVGKQLFEYATDVRNTFAKLLKDASQAPLFPAIVPNFETPGFEFHKTSSDIAATLRDVIVNLSVMSERTGKPIKITAKRFRYTIGTMAAIEGHSELIIADLLDHEDTQNVQVYVKATPAILERMDRTIAMEMAPLAQAFAGILIDDESDAIRGNDPSSRIIDPRIDKTLKPMGSCGQFGFCGLLAPIACYTCKNFQPWLDGPHETVLNFLLAERKRLLTTTDLRIASVRDRIILAVADVIAKCDEKRGKKKKN